MRDSLDVTFEKLNTAFEEAAARRASRTECRVKAGGRIFKLRFASREMREIVLPSLEHLVMPEGQDGPEDFTLNVWDSASTGAPAPFPRPMLANPAAKGESTDLADERFAGHVSHDSGAVSFYDRESRRAIFWMPDARDLPGYHRATPFLPLLQWCFQSAGRQIAHAAAIGVPSGGALLAGKSGSGKSTTAALASEAGLLHLGDDLCVLADEPPRVFALYRSVKLLPGSLRFPALASWSQRKAAWTADDKDVMLLEGDGPVELPLKMILLPRVTGAAETCARPATAAEAVRALAPSSLFLYPRGGREAFAFFARLAKRLPAFHLDLGTDAHNVAALTRRLLEEAP
ncbi:MAG TPA: hypothetical protein VG733_17250 [Chthoniobacteraceae bacterium]|nr:hypothetical protein [Chthoniobacteraceae bacterium]